MRFIVSTKRFATALKQVMPAAGVRSTLPVLTGVRIRATADGITLEATDLEAAARSRLNGDDVTIIKTGEAVTPAKPLAKALAAMSADEVTIEAVDADGKARVSLHAGSRTVTLDTLLAEDFPAIPEGSVFEPLASVTAADLADALARAVLCASRDEARPVQTSVALFLTEGSASLLVVSTDSYRMGVQTVALSEPATATETLLVPARVAKEIAKQMRALREPAAIGRSAASSTARFAFADQQWSTRLIEGEYPNWRQIVPGETGAAVTFEVAEMASALKAAVAVGNGGGAPVRLSLGETSTLALADGEATTIRETLATASFSPDGVGAIEVAFNPSYLADALKFVGEERTSMWVRDGLKPALIGPAERRYLLMPVRLS